ncbi:kinase-like protein [Lophiostoma macrostomum CBS 122681]|uniref:Kinase-like protein n=1 Tax=Lophiostoma macrostomum CBS 122681 TaxID=1314788 RepID=A0A6A6SWF4_9PLEO|nr:kinase-like protein [Lophiostoma macrostomum CBS 122681]
MRLGRSTLRLPRWVSRVFRVPLRFHKRTGEGHSKRSGGNLRSQSAITKPVPKAQVEPSEAHNATIASANAPPGQQNNSSYLAPPSQRTGSWSTRSLSSRSVDPQDRFSSSNEFAEPIHSLQDDLREARVPCARKHNSKFFIPECKLRCLIKADKVTSELCKISIEDSGVDIKELAIKISTSAPHLFAALTYIGRGPEIAELLEEEVSDNDFPFALRDPGHGYSLLGKNGREIKTISKWLDQDSERFWQCQWWINAPIFHEGCHYDLHDNDMLPFINRTSQNIDSGGFSRVYGAEIHRSHHFFSGIAPCDGEDCHVAIKELTAINAEEAFVNETKFFRTLAAKQRRPHQHLMNLLATYRWKNRYHLILPLAKGNLYACWSQIVPKVDLTTLNWCLDQMAGMANGLLQIHGCELPPTESSTPNSEASEPLIKFKKGEEKFGRHGDLKPANILWFAAGEDLWGTLKIADYGLGRFHGRDTRSGIDGTNFQFSPTYEPPELTLKMLVSRKYDMWSLGCILLEFASWILKGKDSTNDFASVRLRSDSNPTLVGFRNDKFFSVQDKARRKAVVREGVVEWVQQLHRHPKCSAFIHDLLNLVMQHLLLIVPGDRIDAVGLDKAFKKFQRMAKRDSGYLVEPKPHPATATPGPSLQLPPPTTQHHTGRHDSDQDTAFLRKKVYFSILQVLS